MAAMWDMHLPWPFNIPCNFSDKPTTYNLTILTKLACCQATYPTSPPKQVAVANGEISHAKHESKLPFPGFFQHASKANTFDSLPQSLMSMAKVSGDGTIFIFKKDGVTVHCEEDVFITCKDVYVNIYDVCETVFTNQTGQFPTCSQSSNKYIMVMVDINSSRILVEPIKNQTDPALKCAYEKLLL
ncbi:hypothetical protein ACHAW6_011685 [Cyclotella cf. meneghiniana]